MSIAYPARPESSGATHLATLLLTAEISTAVLIHVPSIPSVSTNVLLGGLFTVFVATIALCRMPLPPSVRAALIVGLLALILSVGARSDPFQLAATNKAVTESITERDRMAALPLTHVDEPRAASGRRVTFTGSDGDVLASRLDQRLGEFADGDLAITADVTALRDHGGYSVAWAINREGRSKPCGRLTLFAGQFDDSIAQIAKTFETALDQSSHGTDLACY